MAQRGRIQRVSSRRQVGWSGGPGQVVINRATSGQELLSVGAQSNTDGLTLVRMRGYARFWISAAAAAQDGFTGALGFCIVSENAFDIGVTAIPHPVTDDAWDGWMWHSFFTCHSVTATIADGVNASTVVWEKEIDSKAMRKFKETDVLCAVLEVVEVGTSTFNGFVDTRVLAKLP